LQCGQVPKPKRLPPSARQLRRTRSAAHTTTAFLSLLDTIRRARVGQVKRDKAYTKAVDVWSLGVITYILVVRVAERMPATGLGLRVRTG
jgi:hypothetical protein